MTPSDDAILRLLAPPKPLELRTGDIARNTGFTGRQISTRCGVLVEHGLLYKDENGHPYYGITELGQKCVNGEMTVPELEELAEE